jgi:hypothetical protein
MDAPDERPRSGRLQCGQLADVGAAAEGAAAAAEHDDAQAVIARQPLEHGGELVEQRGIDSIDLLRAVEEDARHPALTQDVHHAFIL